MSAQPDRLTPAHRAVAVGAASIVDSAATTLRSIDLRTYAGERKFETKIALLRIVDDLRRKADEIRAIVNASEAREHNPHVDGQMPLFTDYHDEVGYDPERD